MAVGAIHELPLRDVFKEEDYKVKYIVVVPDGASDYPCPELGGKTPMEAAQMPNLNYLAQKNTSPKRGIFLNLKD